jgi:hypothetical protein
MDQTPQPQTQPEELFSLNKLSRKLDIPYSRALVLLGNQTLLPDFIMDRNYLFRASRLADFKEIVAAALSE